MKFITNPYFYIPALIVVVLFIIRRIRIVPDRRQLVEGTGDDTNRQTIPPRTSQRGFNPIPAFRAGISPSVAAGR